MNTPINFNHIEALTFMNIEFGVDAVKDIIHEMYGIEITVDVTDEHGSSFIECWGNVEVGYTVYIPTKYAQ